jgi:large subunit ribosomal protein L27e
VYVLLLYSVKNGKVVVLLNGRFAGRKAIVVKTYDEGRGDRKFGHAIGTTRRIQILNHRIRIPVAEALTWLCVFPLSVAGIDRYPRKVTRAMGKNKLKKRSKVKPFVKYVNYNHIMPTRYVADIDLKKVLDDEVLANPETRVESRKTIKKVFEERYVSPAISAVSTLSPVLTLLCFSSLQLPEPGRMQVGEEGCWCQLLLQEAPLLSAICCLRLEAGGNRGINTNAAHSSSVPFRGNKP